MAWVAIAVCVANIVWTVVWSLVRKPGQRIDRLEAAVFGESGVNMRLAKYVTDEKFETRMAAIDLELRGISEEGQRREDRIVSVIREHGQQMNATLSEIKTDLRTQAQRVDNLITNRGG